MNIVIVLLLCIFWLGFGVFVGYDITKRDYIELIFRDKVLHTKEGISIHELKLRTLKKITNQTGSLYAGTWQTIHSKYVKIEELGIAFTVKEGELRVMTDISVAYSKDQ